MASTQLKTVIPGVVLRVGKEGRSIRFACMVRGTRFTETFTDVPVEMLIDSKGKATRQLRDIYNGWKTKKGEEVGVTGKSGLREPTLGEMLKWWEKFAIERSRDPRYQKPSARSIETALKNFRYCYEILELTKDDNYRKLFNENALQEAFDKFIERGVAGVTAWSYIVSVQTLSAAWTERKWEKCGFLVRRPKMPDPGKAKEAPRYQRPSKELMEKQDLFYASLQDLQDKDPFLVATMVLQFAVRPEDVGLLTSQNFIRGEDGRIYLSYIPNKTKNSSGRRVTWPVPEPIWQQIREYAGDRLDRGEPLVKSVKYVCNTKINPAMRMACGMEGSTKAIYEYRKRCIDYVYHHFGINAAVAISGDNASTIEYYYFDPAMTTMAQTFMTVPIRGVATATQNGQEEGEKD